MKMSNIFFWKLNKEMQESLKLRLLAECNNLDEDFGVVESSYLYLESTIDEVCAQTKFVNTIDDIQVFGI